MAETVLIPLDGSALADNVILVLRRYLRAREGRAVLLRVVQDAPRALFGSRGEVDAARRHLLRARARLAAEGVAAEVQVGRGDPAERILAAAAEAEADLIAMSTHGRSGVRRWVRGSVAERVLRSATTPLLLCTPHGIEEDAWEREQAFRRILVPHDGSELASAILPRVEAVARAHDSEVVLLRAAPAVTTFDVAPDPLGARAARERLAEAARLEESLRPARAALEAAGVRVAVESAFGGERAEILRAANHSDLVAMTTHGRSGPSRWFFGSVAEAVLRDCRRPLLVLRVAARLPAGAAAAATAPPEARPGERT